MIEIDERTARVMIRVLDDITDLDARMLCSDASFRRHFKALATNPITVDALIALKQAVAKPPDSDG